MQRGRWKKIVSRLARLREIVPPGPGGGVAAGDPPRQREADRLSAAQQVGPYNVVRRIGRGGMGEVYEAEDTRLRRRVAIKLLAFKPAPGNQARDRLLREARAASALNHPNIVTIYSIESFDDFDYIVMEYVDGWTLASRIEGRELSLIHVLEAGIQIAAALEAAHSIGVIHRDVKPSNVLMTPHGQIKLVDFGLAKRVKGPDGETARHTASARLTADGTILGTVAYMSPEQTRGEPLDPRTDLFSLGTVLYEAATGRLPFQGPSALYVMHEIAVADPTPPDDLNPDISPEFSAVLLRALAKNKEERFRSAAEMAEHLKRLKEGTPGGSLVEPAVADHTPAEKTRASHGSREGERKRVTILACELADSGSSTQSRDVEETHALLNDFFAVAGEEVSRYEGVINQFRDNGFTALFGAPIAQEHHARRAVLAAIGLRRRLGSAQWSPGHDLPLELCLGVNTGEAIVGSMGDDLRVNYTPVGNTALIAGTLKKQARGGQILMSDTTHRLVEGYCTTRLLERDRSVEQQVSAETWEVLAAPEMRTRLEAAEQQGLTPFVGRERELRLLEECFEKVRLGRGQTVFLVGEAGIGKSRMLREFQRRISERATWNEADAMSFGQSMAFHPLIDLLKRRFRIEEGDSEEVMIHKATDHVVQLDADLEPVLPYLRYLLGVDPGDPSVAAMDPQLRLAELFGAVQRLFLRAAQTSPQILLFEDLHWIDKATEEFLVLTADSIPSSRIMCLFTYRPDHVHPFGDRSYHSRIALERLSSEDTLNMAKAMLAAQRLPDELAGLIVGKAEGNPFFVEEVVRTLRETEAIARQTDGYVMPGSLDEISVPDGIREVLMARIDRLAEGPKRTLQLASVIGREFTGRLLEELAGSDEDTEGSLRELKATELILEKRLFPEATYSFGHALTQEVTYSSLLQRRRRTLHRRTGEVIESLGAERLAEQYAVLAHHFLRGEEWGKAFEYLCKAASKAARDFATREAIALYGQALEVTERLGDAVAPTRVMDIHEARSALAHVVSDYAGSRAEAEQMLVLAQEAGDRVREGKALALIAWACTWSRDLDEAIASASQAIEVARPLDESFVLGRAHYITGFVKAVIGDHDPAVVEIEKALLLSRKARDPVHQSLSLGTAGLLKNWEADYAAAERFQAQGLEIAREHNLLAPLLFNSFVYGITLTGSGSYDEALALFRETLALAEKVGDEAIHHRTLNCLGELPSEGV